MEGGCCMRKADRGNVERRNLDGACGWISFCSYFDRRVESSGP